MERTQRAPDAMRALITLIAIFGSTLVVLPLPEEVRAQARATGKQDTSQLELVFEELVTLPPSAHPGKTKTGEHNIVAISGGTFSGPNLKGTIMPAEWNWQSTTGGCTRLDADYMLKTDDGVMIHAINRATACGKAAIGDMTITAPVFEAPLGRYEWLNDGVFIGSLSTVTVEGKLAVRIRFFKAY